MQLQTKRETLPFTPTHERLLALLEALDVTRIARPGEVAAGTKAFVKKRVEVVAPIADGGIGALVRGKNGRRFEVLLEAADGRAVIRCSCPADTRGCEHAVAALLAARSHGKRWRKDTAPSHEAAPAAAPPIPRPPPRDRAGLTAWATNNKVSDHLETLSELFIEFALGALPRLESHIHRLRYARATLAQLIVTSELASFGIPQQLRDAAATFLTVCARRRAEHRKTLSERRWGPASDPRLQPHVDALFAAYGRLVAAGVISRPPEEQPDHELGVSVYPAWISVDDVRSSTWSSKRTVIHLEPNGTIRLEHAGGSSADAAKLEAIELVLNVMTNGDHARLMKEFADELAIPGWQRLVNDLRQSVAGSRSNDLAADEELGWRLSLRAAGQATLAPVLCTPKVRGGWRVKKLDTGLWAEVDHLMHHDGDAIAMRTAMLGRGGSYGPERPHEVALGLALTSLVGHPRIFYRDGSRDRHLALRRGRLAVATRDRADGGFQVGVEADGVFWSAADLRQRAARIPLEGALLLIDDASDGAVIYPLTLALRRLIVNLARHADVLPAEAARPFVNAALAVREQVPLAVSEGLRGPAVAGDARVRLRLELGQAGLAVTAVTRPAAELASEVPGEGPRTLYLERDGAMVAVERDLAGERAAAQRLWEELALPRSEAFSAEVPLDAAAFDLVRDVGGRDGLEVEWSGARRLAVERAITLDKVALEAKRGKGKAWFSLHGDAAVAGGGVVPLAELLRAIRERQRYVRVDGDRWAEIDQALARRMSAVAKHDGQLPALMAPVVADLEDAGASLEGFAELRASLERLRTARGLVIAAPAGLEAELRPYQAEGFQWLARLAEWAPGACLADDMGLGKTVQAIALMLHRKGAGPSLVIAPTSLGFNWVRELERFAPSLKVRAARSGSELLALKATRAGEVVVTSYGIAVRHVEVLADMTWGTLVIDEAQSLKNAATRRAQALRRLTGGFCLALTGTPVENRASELWSLFRLIAPGLLGSEASFRADFAGPIERGDEVARAGLAALIAPFVLRRVKRDVARDLPERTEVELEVVLGKRERERYEEIRKATLRLLDGADDTPGAQRTFKALQALTRLRQLACHPALLDPKWEHGSRKLDALAELIGRLMEEGHKALVFSQFTSFLALAKARLDALGAKMLYLDGQTPPAERQARVDAFQAGAADVFLLSLKAGGTGLNLTAATYVIHLDPWWNPAVEDQATDRTHRIGQDQPVTVYRLIAKDTVEEGIVKLHGDKRELADALLAGAGSSASLGYDEMVQLICGVSGEGAPIEDDGDEAEQLEVPMDAPAPALAPVLALVPPAADDLAGALAKRLATAAEAGEISRSTAGTYARSARRYVAFATEKGLDPRARTSLDAYLAALATGAIKAGASEPAVARAAFKWIDRTRPSRD